MISAKSMYWQYQERGYSKISFCQVCMKKYTWSSVFKIERVLTNENAEYCLSEEVQDLPITAEVWYQWSYECRMKNIKPVMSLEKNYTENKKEPLTI